MSRYKPYPKYKESGVEWLGEVPEQWEVMKLKYIAHSQPSNIDKKSKDGEPDVLLCNYTDVYYNDFITNEIDFMKATATYDQINKFRLDVGDVIITKDSEGPEDIAIAAYVKETQDNLVCGYHLTLIKPTECVGSYLFRAINSTGLHDQFKVAANGITRYGLSVYGINNVLLPVPSSKEQTTIANFLDRETAKIDTLIGKQERLIELLQEKRQALISHAVTKGLDPNVKMKDSGVEWLGEVPEHWEVSRLGYVTNKIGSGKTPKGGSEIYVDEGVLFIRSQNVYDDGLRTDDVVYISKNIDEEMSASRVKSGDILLNITGASLGRTTLVPENIEKANVNQHVCIIRVSNKKERFFISWIMKSTNIKAQINIAQTGAAREGLNFDQISNLMITLPPLKEQQQIADYLDTQTAKIDILIQKALQAITLLKARREALISAAVTGKIDVRESA